MLKNPRNRAMASYGFGGLCGLMAIVLLAEEVLKISYISNFPFRSDVIRDLYSKYMIIRVFWYVTSDPSNEVWKIFNNITVMVALSLFLVGAWFTGRAQRGFRLISEATSFLDLQKLIGSNGNHQSIGNIQSDGNVTINQINHAHEKVEKIAPRFWEGISDKLVVGVLLPLLVAILSFLLGLK
ncbi:MAG: hypothetical protein ABF876_17825 [Acetobacter aceti]|uniref:Uncharacterized protein n=1 Tax=Acetobacter aceti TaxID=435 RepID=A0A1U9KJI9_ACEAC|nr:hypothetical protein [Acetobacter aceti]AQS85943.1 hypothetical protein A0U92_15545 [Acetobacter aceti]